MSTVENKDLVCRFEEKVWNERNPALVDEFFAASHIFRAPGSPPLDREGHRQMIAHFQSAFPFDRVSLFFSHPLLRDRVPAEAVLAWV